MNIINTFVLGATPSPGSPKPCIFRCAIVPQTAGASSFLGLKPGRENRSTLLGTLGSGLPRGSMPQSAGPLYSRNARSGSLRLGGKISVTITLILTGLAPAALNTISPNLGGGRRSPSTRSSLDVSNPSIARVSKPYHRRVYTLLGPLLDPLSLLDLLRR